MPFNIIKKNPTAGEITSSLTNSTDAAGLHFDGAAGNIDIASPPDLGTKFSFELIIQADAWGSAAYLIDFGNGGRFLFGSHAGISLNLGIYDNASWNSFGVKVLDDFKVHHLTLTIDGTAAILYDNGNQVGTATISASHGIDSCADAKIAANYVAGDLFNGTIYRARFWNKTLSQAEVTASFENSTVPFADQYGSQTELVSGSFANSTTADRQFDSISGASATGFTGVYDDGVGSNRVGATLTAALTAGKNYRATFDYTGSDGGMGLYTSTGATIGGFQELGTLTAASATGHKVDFTVNAAGGDYISFIDSSPPASGSFVVSNLSLVEIGCVSDYDLAFAQPEISTIIQNRSGSGDGTASSGVTQVTPIEQLNSKSARIGTSAATPADGDLLVSGNVGVGTSSFDGFYGNLQLGDTSTASSALNLFNSTTGTGGVLFADGASGDDRVRGRIEYKHATNSLHFRTDAAERLTIDSAGNVGIDCDPDGIGLRLERELSGSWAGLIKNTHATNGYGFKVQAGNDAATDSFRVADVSNNTLMSVNGAGLATFSAGIAFQSATTGSGTGTGYTLDAYEVGTWTPALSAPASGTLAYTSSGLYTRIGDQVHIQASITITTATSLPTSALIINNAPFNAKYTAASKYYLNSFPLSRGSGVIIADRTEDMHFGFYNDGNALYLFTNIDGAAIQYDAVQVGEIQFAGTYTTKDA